MRWKNFSVQLVEIAGLRLRRLDAAQMVDYRTNLYLNRAPSASISPVVGCGKWIGKTYWPVPEISVRNFRRERAACAGSQSKIVDQSGSRHCKVWCMRSPITTACCPRERVGRVVFIRRDYQDGGQIMKKLGMLGI